LFIRACLRLRGVIRGLFMDLHALEDPGRVNAAYEPSVELLGQCQSCYVAH
jgi:hypothetical protein